MRLKSEKKNKSNSYTRLPVLPDLEKEGTISNVLKCGQEIIVQIIKEPISTKGPRLTTEISFAGITVPQSVSGLSKPVLRKPRFT